MTSNEIRENFLKFFENRGHKVIPSASLVPENDPSVLFTTAGMHPLVPYLLGEKHPLGKRLADVQKCLRTDDIEEVGDSAHLTFFEMLGYWSLGDYFKKESIEFTFGFYTEVLGFNKDDISVTVFAGEGDIAFDQESFDTWKNVIGIPEERIYKYNKKENWWGPVGETGPCGPCTEMFIDTGIDACGPDCGPSCNCDKFVEIGNNVFMEFNKTADGKLEKLVQHNVDVGLGLERLAMFSQKKTDVFQTDIFEPIIKKIEELSGKKYEDKQKEFRIVADHIKAAAFAISDGAIPSNKGVGYVTRRLIRRAIIKAKSLGINDNFLIGFTDIINGIFGDIYSLNLEIINNELEKEENKFRKTLGRALRELDTISRIEGGHVGEEFKKDELSADKLFHLYQSFGMPLEISLEEAKNRSIKIREGAIGQFKAMVRTHQELSRTASAGMFKGGLADSKEETTKLHTAAHLLLAGLRAVLGDHVTQKGANITEERLRFDFAHPEKVMPEQILEVEKFVNEQISKKLPVTMEEMSVSEAKEQGAMGVFDDKYGNKVKVYTIGEGDNIVSKEICGGPHVANISELGEFKITKEESSSSGVRRIKAILQ